MRALLLSVLLLPACATSFSTGQEAQALGLSVVEAIEGSADCAAMAARLEAALAGQSARIAALADAATPPTEDGPDAGEQRRLLRIARRVRDCAGTAPGTAAELAVAPLAKLTQRPPATEDAGYDCADDCCAQGWQTWAEVTYFSATCLGGDDRACCMAVTIASYDACIRLHCPGTECCTRSGPRRSPDQ